MFEEDESTIEGRADSLYESLAAMKIQLIHLRRAHGLEQAEVGARMGVSQSAVSQFERHDSNPTLATVRRYALAVGARLDITVIDDAVPSDSNNAPFGELAQPGSAWTRGH